MSVSSPETVARPDGLVSVIEGTAVVRILVGAAESDPERTCTYAAADNQTA
jgi:hypothetical protein